MRVKERKTEEEACLVFLSVFMGKKQLKVNKQRIRQKWCCVWNDRREKGVNGEQVFGGKGGVWGVGVGGQGIVNVYENGKRMTGQLREGIRK